MGHGSMSPEASSDTKYLCRAATVSEHHYFIVEPPLSSLEIFYSRLISPIQNCPYPPPKTARVGEIGWGVPKFSDNSLLKSKQQIMVWNF